MRSTRQQPWCWQEKKVFRILRANHKGAELVKLRCLYDTITEIDSDFNSKPIKYYTKTISTYSGLSPEWIPSGLKTFMDLQIIEITEDKVNGKYKGKTLAFTPEKLPDLPRKTVPGKTVNGKTVNGETDTSEDSIVLEDSTNKKNGSEPDPLTVPLNKEIIDLFYQRYKFLYNENLNITAKEIGQIKNIIKRAGGDRDTIMKKMEALYLKCAEDRRGFWTYTPGRLINQWNELTGTSAAPAPAASTGRYKIVGENGDEQS